MVGQACDHLFEVPASAGLIDGCEELRVCIEKGLNPQQRFQGTALTCAHERLLKELWVIVFSSGPGHDGYRARITRTAPSTIAVDTAAATTTAFRLGHGRTAT